MNLLFDGPLGLVAGRIMAKRNASAEVEALDELAPGPSDSVLLIGFGPGAGIDALRLGCRPGESVAWTRRGR